MIRHIVLIRPIGSLFILTAFASAVLQINTLTAKGDNSPPANPLNQPISAAGADALSGDAQKFGDFTILGSTQVGKTLFIKLPAAQSLELAITQTADALGKILDGKPDVTGAFADSKSKNNGGALFTGKLKGVDLRGWIFCSVGTGGGAAASVVIAPADVSKADASALFGFMPGQTKMTTHVFPDGSGSVDLPDGWTTQQTSISFGCAVVGPAGQTVVFHNSINIYTPDCRQVKQSQQTYQLQMNNYQNQLRQYQQMEQMHERYPNTVMSPPPKEPKPLDPDPNVNWPNQNFCRLCSGADEVLKYWYPISEEKAKRRGGPWTHLEKVIEIVPADANPLIPGSKEDVAYIAVTDHDGDKATAVRALIRISTYPIFDGADEWTAVFCNMRAPDTTFDRDLPVMNQIMNSIKLNMDVVNQQIAQSGAAVRKMGEENERALLQRGRDFQEQQAEHFDNFESQIAAQEQATHDASSDEIEYISGVRDVYDNVTGTMGQVDLFDVHGIVSGMNISANDPNRFVEIPLRYER